MCAVVFGANDFDFEKCGDVIVAPKQNIFALTCSLCHDVFMQFDEFRIHIVKEHDVYLGFNIDGNSVDEEEELEDAIEPSKEATVIETVNNEKETNKSQDHNKEKENETNTDIDNGKIDNDVCMKNTEMKDIGVGVKNELQGGEKAVKNDTSVDFGNENNDENTPEKLEDRNNTKNDENSKELGTHETHDNENQALKNAKPVDIKTEQRPPTSNETQHLQEIIKDHTTQEEIDSTSEENYQNQDSDACNKQKSEHLEIIDLCDSTMDVESFKNNQTSNDEKGQQESCLNAKETQDVDSEDNKTEKNVDSVEPVDDITENNLKAVSLEDDINEKSKALQKESEAVENVYTPVPEKPINEHIEIAADNIDSRSILQKNAPKAADKGYKQTHNKILQDEDYADDDSNPETDEHEAEETNEALCPEKNLSENKTAQKELETVPEESHAQSQKVNSMLNVENEQNAKEDIIEEILDSSQDQDESSVDMDVDQDISSRSSITSTKSNEVQDPFPHHEHSKILSPDKHLEDVEVIGKINEKINDFLAEIINAKVGKSNSEEKPRDESVQKEECEKVLKTCTKKIERSRESKNTDIEKLKQFKYDGKKPNFSNWKIQALKSDCEIESDDEMKEYKPEEIKQIANDGTEISKIELSEAQLRNRRKSIKIAEIFEDLELEHDEEDEDMKILENIMLRDDSSCSYADEEIKNKKDETKQVETTKKSLEETANTENDANEYTRMDKATNEHIGKKVGKTEKMLSTRQKSDKNKIECDKYVDDKPLIMEDDSLINIETNVEIEKEKGSKSEDQSFSMRKVTEKKKKDILISPITKSNNKTLINRKITPKPTKKMETLETRFISPTKKTEICCKSLNSKSKSITQPAEQTSIILQEKNNELLTPKNKKKPMIDTPRPTQLVDRSIFGKKRKLSEELLDTNTLPFAEINQHIARKLPKLEVLETNSTTNQTQQKKTISSDTLNFPTFNLPKSLEIKKISSLEENKAAVPLRINNTTIISTTTSPTSSSSSSSSLLNISNVALQGTTCDHQKNPVTESVKKLIATPSVTIKTKSINLKAKLPEVSDNVDEVDVLSDLYNQITEEPIVEPAILETRITSEQIQAFNDEYDAILLNKVGLNIIVDADFETHSPSDKIKNCRRLAQKLAETILDSKLLHKPGVKDNFTANEKFKAMLDVINSFLSDNSKLKLMELKRIVNLTTLWTRDFLTNMNSNIETTEVQKYYLHLFSSQKTRRSLYCEHCTTWYNNVEKLENHRSLHTNSMACAYCFKLYKVFGRLDAHMENCKSRFK